MSVAYVYVRNTKPSKHNQWNTNHGGDDTQHQKCSQARNKNGIKVCSSYDPFAYFSKSFISGESLVITIELNLIFKAYNIL